MIKFYVKQTFLNGNDITRVPKLLASNELTQYNSDSNWLTEGQTNLGDVSI